MSTPGLIPVIESVVDSKVQNGEMFTAHDVTIEVRTRGHRAGHIEVRDSVHDYYQRGGMGVGYARTTITVPGGTPFLYHRTVDDPANYTNIRGSAAGSSTPVVPTSNQQTISIPSFTTSSTDDGDDDDNDDDDDDDDIASNSLISSVAGVAVAVATPPTQKVVNKPGAMSSRCVDGRATLSVPSPVIRQVGFHVGQKVYAVASQNGVDLTATAPTPGSVCGKYTVDRYAQVRITQSLLKRAGIPGNSYDLQQVGNKIVVKLAK